MSDNNTNLEIDSIVIKRIKEVSFFINEPLIAKRYQDGNKLSIQIALKLSFTIDVNVVFLLTRAFYHYQDSMPDEILTDIQVQNIFEISNLKKFQVGESEIKLPESMIVSLVSVSISHTRALMAKNIIGTSLQENNLELIDPKALAQHFFPNMFALK